MQCGRYASIHCIAILYTQQYFINTFDTTQYLIKAIFKNSMVLNTKVDNLKHIYFQMLGWAGDWVKIFIIIFNIFKYCLITLSVESRYWKANVSS